MLGVTMLYSDERVFVTAICIIYTFICLIYIVYNLGHSLTKQIHTMRETVTRLLMALYVRPFYFIL